MAPHEQRPSVSPRARLYSLTSLAFTFPVSIAAGAFAGYYLDGKLGTFPWLSILFLFFGVAAGFLSLLRAVNTFDAQSGSTPEADNAENGTKGG